jgi:hypothetical protein
MVFIFLQKKEYLESFFSDNLKEPSFEFTGSAKFLKPVSPASPVSN